MARKFKIAAQDHDTFRTLVERALQKHLNTSESNETVTDAMGKMHTLVHHEYDVKDMLEDSNATMKEMDSNETPLSNSFDIELKRLGSLPQIRSSIVKEEEE